MTARVRAALYAAAEFEHPRQRMHGGMPARIIGG